MKSRDRASTYDLMTDVCRRIGRLWTCDNGHENRTQDDECYRCGVGKPGVREWVRPEEEWE